MILPALMGPQRSLCPPFATRGGDASAAEPWPQRWLPLPCPKNIERGALLSPGDKEPCVPAPTSSLCEGWLGANIPMASLGAELLTASPASVGLPVEGGGGTSVLPLSVSVSLEVNLHGGADGAFCIVAVSAFLPCATAQGCRALNNHSLVTSSHTEEAGCGGLGHGMVGQELPCLCGAKPRGCRILWPDTVHIQDKLLICTKPYGWCEGILLPLSVGCACSHLPSHPAWPPSPCSVLCPRSS